MEAPRRSRIARMFETASCGRWREAMQAKAATLQIGTLVPPLELPDTEGNVHTLPMPGEAPATVVFWTCNHCPYALAWHERLLDTALDYAPRGVRFLAVNSNDAERYPRDSLEAMRDRVRKEDWPLPYLHDESQGAARD